MKKTLLMFATLTGALVVAGGMEVTAAHAGGSANPTQCVVQASGSINGQAFETPNCDTIREVCVIYTVIDAGDGPARRAHAAPAGLNGPCASFDPACVVVAVPPNPPGPSRGVHAVGAPRGGNQVPYGETFNIPSVCFELPTAGVDLEPLTLAGLAAVAAGAMLGAVTRRRRPARVAA